MATQTATQQPFNDCGNPACGSGCSKDVPDPGASGDLHNTSNGTCVNTRSFAGGTYGYDYSTTTTSGGCMSCAKKSDDPIDFSWNRLSGQDSLASAYPDTWMPAGAGGVFSFLPRVTLNDIPAGGQRVYSRTSPAGTLSYDSSNNPQAELPIFAFRTGSTYFTTYDQKAGVYFEYFGGGLSSSDWRFGRINRQYDSKGNVIQYNYTPRAGGTNALLRSLSGDVAGNVLPYFYYANETIDASHFAPITQISLIDLVTPQNTRTTYYTYTNETDAGGNVRPYLTQIVNPVDCVTQYTPQTPFPLGDPGDPYQISHDVDADGYDTMFEYSGGLLTTIFERLDAGHLRTTYYEEPSVGETHQTQDGRGKRFVKYALSSFGDQMTRVGLHMDPLGNTTYYSYNTTISRMVYQVDANGNLTYFEYAGGSTNKFALSRKVAAFNQAQTYFGYNLTANNFPTYDLVKKVGPRWVAGTNIEVTYYTYDVFRNQTAMVDALGDTTLFGYDSLGHLIVVEDARGDVTYYNYGAVGGQTSMVDALGNVTYYGYNSFLDRTAVVSPRWPEINFAAFTTYYVYDQLSRRTKIVDAQNNVTYFDYTGRGDLADTVDAVLTERAYTYTGLRLRSLDTTTAASGTILAATYYGYDIYKNNIQTMDGRFNTTYYFYDQLNRQNAILDPLLDTTYFYYDSAGNRTAATDARGNTTYFFYDLLSRKSARRDTLGNLTYYFYDLANNLTSLADALGYPAYFFYDALDRRQATRDALGNPAYFYYDAVSNQSSTIDARFNPTYYFYDADNRRSASRDAVGNLLYFGYDANGNQIRMKDARGNTTYFTFDTLDRQKQLVDALSNATYFGYDAVSNRVRVMDARFNTIYYFYDGLKRTTAMQDALGDVSYYYYDFISNRTAQTDPRGNTTYYFYDPLNRTSVIRDMLGDATYFGYDPVSNRVRNMDARFNTTYYTYDALNRRTAAVDPLGNTTLSGYDAVGNLTVLDRGVVTGAGGVTSYYFYDGMHRRTAMQDALGTFTYYFYDATSNPTATRTPLLRTTYFGYDAINRLVQSQDPTGATTYFGFDANSNQIQLTDPDNHTTLMQFDALNRTSAVRYADTGSTYFFYDPVSNRTKDVDALGKAVYYKYDAINRLTAIQDGLGRTCYYQYDAASNRNLYLDGEGASSTFTYDAINRVTNIAYAVAGAIVAGGLAPNPYYVYDPVSNLTQMGDFWGLHGMGYDADNRLSQHQFPNSNVVYFRYDPRSNVTARVYPGTSGTSGAAYDALDRQIQVQAPSGATAYFSYDADSNLTGRLLGNSMKLAATYDACERIQMWRYANASGGSLSYFDYTRDTKGLITKSVREATYTVYYSYDACDRLASEIWAKTGGTPSEVYGYRYNYDLAGNRLKALINGSATYYFYDQANQLTVKGTSAKFASPTYYAYDKNGSLITEVQSSGTTKFAYNAAGLVAQILWADASTTYFLYDGALRRYGILQNGMTYSFLWDGLDVLQQVTMTGAHQVVVEEYTQAKSPMTGIGQLVEVNRPSLTPQKIYPVMDPRGSITKYLQSDGATLVASREYDSFGNLIPNSGSGTWPGVFGYQGQAWQEIQSANGQQRLLLSPTRVYDPIDGKFVSRDPVALKGPGGAMPLYIYVAQNPILIVDRDGRDISYLNNSGLSPGFGGGLETPGGGISPGFGGGIDIVVPGMIGGPNVATVILNTQNPAGIVYQPYNAGLGAFFSWANPLAFNPISFNPLSFNPLAFNPLAGAGAATAWALVGGLAGLIGFGNIFGCIGSPLECCTVFQDAPITEGWCVTFCGSLTGANQETLKACLSMCYALVSAKQRVMEWWQKTASDYISEFCLGKIRSVFPGELLNKTLYQIWKLQNDPDLGRKAKTAWKLLTSNEYQKQCIGS